MNWKGRWAMVETQAIVRDAQDGERRWFLGGGLHVWKLTTEDTRGELLLFHDRMVEGKMTPLHRHPEMSETLYVLDGTITAYVDGAPREIGAGGVAYFPRGVPHAFCVTSEVANLLCFQSPGTGQPFYLAASEPAVGESGPVDFRRLAELAREHGVVEILGPPPFAR